MAAAIGACFECGGFGHLACECPTKQQPQVAPRAVAPKHTSNVPKKNAQLHFMTIEEAQVDDGVIIGMLAINSISARLLFDSSASHSFIQISFKLWSLGGDFRLVPLESCMSLTT